MRSRNFLSCIVVAALVLAGCMPIQTSTMQAAANGLVPLLAQTLNETELPWVDDEIVFFGARDDIHKLLLELPDEVRAQLEIDPSDPQPEAEFDLTSLVIELLARPVTSEEPNELFGGFFGGRPLPEQLQQRIVAQRYHFIKKDENDIPRFIEFVDGVRGEPIPGDLFSHFKYFVFAEPNFWLTSLQGEQECTSLSGQPNSFGNGPFGTGVESSGSVSNFNDQWAFQLLTGNSVTSPHSDPLKNGVAAEGPQKVDVVTFDTSPFTDVTETPTGTGPPQARTIELTTTQTMTLHVLHWTMGLSATQPISDSDEHGVFVTSLIHKVAPNSTLSLVRILDGEGCGVAYAFNNALAEYVKNYLVAGHNTVINLSLGIPKTVIETLPKMYLEVVLTNYLAAKNIVVVAAAGNDQGEPLLLPAGYVDDSAYRPYVRVIAVEASNISGHRACFSNKGIDGGGDGKSDHAVLAPGGEGTSPCKPELTACANNPVCEQAILGRTHDQHWVFWSGTSFATPLVSGVAARWLSQGCLPATVNAYFANANGVLANLTTPPSCP